MQDSASSLPPDAVFTPFLVSTSDIASSEFNESQNILLLPADSEAVSRLSALYNDYYPREKSINMTRVMTITWELRRGPPGSMEVSAILFFLNYRQTAKTL